ncbi:MAG: Slp family lipoprotein [Desulfobacterales bacterium]|nr:Slp family lipoprotein [Desulfobacterales bacterium]
MPPPSVDTPGRPLHSLAQTRATRRRPARAVAFIVALLSAGGWLTSCTVMSARTMAEADPPLPFPMLAAKAEDFEGRVVILGGYVLEVRNRGQHTVLVVLQAPLSGGQEPVDADRSQGRFMVLHERFLDPEVFTKGRKVTVGGVVRGVTTEAIGEDPYDYLTLASREIFLWEREEYLPGPYFDRSHPYYDTRYRRPYDRRY